MERASGSSRRTGERHGRRIGAAAAGMVAAATFAGSASMSPAGASTFHDTWGRNIVHALTTGGPHAAVAKAIPAVAVRAAAVAIPLPLADQIRQQRAPRTGGNAAMVLAALNAVRAQFGLAPAKPTTVGNPLVHNAALAGGDPVLLPVSASIPLEYGIWGAVGGTSTSSQSAIQSVVNAWVFHDGWLGAQTNNLDCTSPTAPGCNGHRDAILSSPPVPGAQLYADIAVLPSTLNGMPAVSMAAQLIWVAP